jgi:hypothetical protein
VAPFFRIPGFGRTNAIDNYLAEKKLITWSADIDTDDWWRGSTAKAVVQRAMRRLDAKGRGIILMHDIHPATVMALPELLKQLKANGYHVVQVVAAGERPATLPELVASPASDKEAWPRVLQTSASSTEGVVLRHRIKKALAARHRPAKLAAITGGNSNVPYREYQQGQF